MTPGEVRFAADGMLQSLATWLRLLGYDCIAGPGLFGRGLLERALAENRVFLTRNAHLANNLPHALLERGQIAHVVGEHLPDQLREVVARYSLQTEQHIFTRCTECNELLRRADRIEVVRELPRNVAESETQFWRCPQCGKNFWRGSHVRNSLHRLQQWLANSGDPSSRGLTP